MAWSMTHSDLSRYGKAQLLPNPTKPTLAAVHRAAGGIRAGTHLLCCLRRDPGWRYPSCGRSSKAELT